MSEAYSFQGPCGAANPDRQDCPPHNLPPLRRYFFFGTLGRLGSPKCPPSPARKSRSIFPTSLETVSCRGSVARMATPVTLPFSLRPHTSMFSLSPPLLMPTMRLHWGA